MVPQKTQNLRYELLLKESGNYMVTHNIDTSDGLTNGATCKITKVQCVNNNPSVVWVLFLDKEVGSITRQKNRHLFSTSSDLDQCWTPILKIQREFQVGKNNKVKVVRKQFPLTPAEAITIHKSQGSTIDKAAISFKGTIQKHMVYVALSRLQTLDGMRLLNFDPKQISIDPLVQQEMGRLRTVGLLSCNRDVDTECLISIVSHNARSLHKNIQHYRDDYRISDVDVMVVQETWAKPDDQDDYYKLAGFQQSVCLFTQKRNHRPHSGTFIYVKTGLDVISSQQEIDSGIEGASVVVSKNSVLYEVISIYCHPPGNKEKITKMASKLKSGNSICLIAGDYNINHLDQSNCTSLVNAMNTQLGAKPIIDGETTEYHTALDKIYSTDPRTKGGTLETYWSDHKMIWAAIKSG